MLFTHTVFYSTSFEKLFNEKKDLSFSREVISEYGIQKIIMLGFFKT
jgi:hypothetical protein